MMILPKLPSETDEEFNKRIEWQYKVIITAIGIIYSCVGMGALLVIWRLFSV